MRIRATAAMAAVLLCAAISESAQAAAPGNYKVYGAGNESCGTWLDARREAPKEGTGVWPDLGQWVMGWLSAAGYYNVQGRLRDTDSHAISAWLDKYCREHPLNELKDAASSLVDELSKPK